MDNKEPYTITVKAILIALIIMVFLGAVAGLITARLETKAFLKKNTQGSNIIQNVQLQTTEVSSFQHVVETEKGNVVGLLDQNNKIVQAGTILTADGLLITPISSNTAQRSIKVLLADERIVSAFKARSYPEMGVAFYRLEGTFSAPHFSTAETLSAGTEGVVLHLVNSNPNVAVFPLMVERFMVNESMDEFIFREQQAQLVVSPGEQYLGAPAFDRQSNLLGISVNSEKGIILPIKLIDLVLQDYLKHNAGDESVTVLSGVEGTWVDVANPDGKMVPAFEIDALNKGSNLAQGGVLKQDVIYTVNDKNFPNIQLWGALLESMRSTKPMTLGIMRGAEVLKVTIQNVKQQ